jgi:hypothetical protein
MLGDVKMISYLNLTVNGKELRVPVELTESQIRSIYNATEHNTNKTGWEKPIEGQLYFYEDALCRVQSIYATDNSKIQLDMLYEKANCYSSETIANNIARGDILIRNLRRFAALHNSKKMNEKNCEGYTITYNYMANCLECGATGNWRAVGDIVFETEEIAKEAMIKFADELNWYFTQMKTVL